MNILLFLINTAILLFWPLSLEKGSVWADDIDIYTQPTTVTSAGVPNVLIILDNTANWNNNAQHWPGGVTQGESEIKSLAKVLYSLPDDSVNVGLMMNSNAVGGSGTGPGGYIRFAMRRLDATTKEAWLSMLGMTVVDGEITPLSSCTVTANSLNGTPNCMYQNAQQSINSSGEQGASSAEYSRSMFEAFKYFGGYAAPDGTNTPVNQTQFGPYRFADNPGALGSIPRLDSAAFSDWDSASMTGTIYNSPSNSGCQKNFVIFIGNGLPSQDSAAISTDKVADGSADVHFDISPLPWQNYTQNTVTGTDTCFHQTACKTSTATCSSSDYPSQCTDGTYTSCSCGTQSTTGCSSTTSSSTSQIATTSCKSDCSTTDFPTTCANATAPVTPSTYSACACQSYGTSCGEGGGVSIGTVCSATTPSYPSGCTDSLGTTYATCTAGAQGAVCAGPSEAATTTTLSTAACLTSAPSLPETCGGTYPTYGSCSIDNSGACSSTSTSLTHITDTNCQTNCGSNDYPSTCSNAHPTPDSPTYSTCVCGTGVATGCTGSRKKYPINGYRITYGNTYGITGKLNTYSYNYDITAQTGSTFTFGIDGTITTTTTDHKDCIDGTFPMVTMVASGTPTTPSGSVAKLYADEWARYMHQGDTNSTSGQQPIVTYALNVFKNQPSADQTALLQNMATYGGGKYFEATSETQITSSLSSIFSEIQAVNSVFAATSLPVNATNRSQNENQVFIGMFRPDPDAKPRWLGNTKRYQIGYVTGTKLDLVDKNGLAAINTNTGFITDCATSYWTTDTTFDDAGTSYGYWENTGVSPSPKGVCSTIASTQSPWSDAPDGPFVEKGAVALVLRRGNDTESVSATGAPPWPVNRSVKTLSTDGTALADFSTATATSVSQTVVNFIKGHDVSAPQEYPYNTITDSPGGTRPSIHGDVVHSRPMAVNYGDSTGVVVFYGANDGTYRAVRASDGKELWAFVAPETFSQLQRLYAQSPVINYPSVPGSSDNKGYFFDGSTGIWQQWTDDVSTSTYIFPSARRGGSFVYGLDVSTPTVPIFKWRHPDPTSATDVENFSKLGQTWSLPSVAYVKGYPDTTDPRPLVIFGGGYNTCEDVNYPDTDTTNFTCANGAQGASVYVVDAQTGALQFSATLSDGRSVAGDITLVDFDSDGFVEFGYFADTAGHLYRLNFVDASLNPTTFSVKEIAYTHGAGRKFLFAPAALLNNSKVFLALGSGDREHPLSTHYPYTTPIQNRFYVFIDDPITDNQLATPYNLDDDTAGTMTDFSDPTGCTTSAIVSDPDSHGWFIDLCGETDPCPATSTSSNRGEQTVTPAVIAGGVIFFSTNRPTPEETATCSANLGEARGYAVNLVTASGVVGTTNRQCGGNRSGTFIGGGLAPPPVVARVPVSTDSGTKTVSALFGGIQMDNSPSSIVGVQEITPPATSGSGKRSIVYWHTGSD
ncbi:MAG: hypothetical protein HW380_848 [Magnetococcales bacterium]|nr:hypothetical protein [Magnetococcales bacterium]